MVSFLVCSVGNRQFGDLHLVAASQALQRMELSPLFKQVASVPQSRIGRLSTVPVNGRQVINLMNPSKELRRFRLEGMTFHDVEASASFRLISLSPWWWRGQSISSVGFFISYDSNSLAIVLCWMQSELGTVTSGLVVQSVPTQGVESKTLRFVPLKLAQDEWIELSIRSDGDAVVATIAGQDIRTPVEGFAENTSVDVGLSVVHADYVVDQLRIGGQEITPRQFEWMVLRTRLKNIALRELNPDFQLGGNPLSVTKGYIGGSKSGEYRDALTAVPRSLFEFAIDVDQRTDLTFAIGYQEERLYGSRLTRFTVQVVDAKGKVHDVFVSPPGDTTHYGAWRDYTVDLTRFQNTRVTLRFLTDVPGGVKQENWDIAFWGDPRLQQPDPPPTAQPNVVLISMDALRPDHLGCYGYPRPTSPFIDSVAAKGVVFDRAFSHAPWTIPSHMSMLTGMPVGFHEIIDPSRIAPPVLRTLAELYAAAGYRTAAFTGDGAFWGGLGFFQGFQRYFDAYGDDEMGDWTARIMEKTCQWLTEEGDQPFFLFFHTYEPHQPGTHTHFLPDSLVSENYTRHEMAGIDRYDSDIYFVDGYMRQLLAVLEEIDALPRTIIVFTSDHGDELFDRSDSLMMHAHSLHRDVLQVPLILSGPGVPGAVRVKDVVGLADVAPTLLALCGLPIPESIRGRSVVPLMNGKREDPRPVFSVLGKINVPEPMSIIYKDYHLILHMDKLKEYEEKVGRVNAAELAKEESVQLYDYIADPNEMHNLAKKRLATVAELKGLLKQHLQEINTAKVPKAIRAPQLDEKIRRQLKALGYIK